MRKTGQYLNKIHIRTYDMYSANENPPTLDNNALSIYGVLSVYTMHDDYDIHVGMA